MAKRSYVVLVEQATIKTAEVTWEIDADEYAAWLGDLQDSPNKIREFIRSAVSFDDEVIDAALRVPRGRWREQDGELDLVEIVRPA